MNKVVAAILALGFIGSVHAQSVDFYYKSPMPAGKYKGLLIDTSSVRPVVPLDGTVYGGLNDTPETHYLIANFFHEGHFYIAKIPKVGAQMDYFQRVKFGFMAYHSMSRIHMAVPIELVAMIPSEDQAAHDQVPSRLDQPILIYDALATIEAAFLKAGQMVDGHVVKPENFNLIKGLMDHFGLAYRLISVEARAEQYFNEAAAGDLRPIEQYETNFKPSEVDAILRTFIKKSYEIGNSETYNTIQRQCTISNVEFHRLAVPFLDRDAPLLARWWNAIWDKVFGLDAVIPTFTPFGLEMRGELVGDVSLDGKGIKFQSKTENLEVDPSVAADFADGRSRYGGGWGQYVHPIK